MKSALSPEETSARSMKRMQEMMAPRQSGHVTGLWRCVHPARQPKALHKFEIGDIEDRLVFATKRHPRTVRSCNRKRNKIARASRKRNRA